jgi:ParD-like antitoxin of type II bacterial toxin-antitoxin system
MRGYVMAIALKLSDELVEIAKSHAAANHRSVPKQIEHWAWLGKVVEENPDLPVQLILDTLLAVNEAKAGQLSQYRFSS